MPPGDTVGTNLHLPAAGSSLFHRIHRTTVQFHGPRNAERPPAGCPEMQFRTGQHLTAPAGRIRNIHSHRAPRHPAPFPGGSPPAPKSRSPMDGGKATARYGQTQPNTSRTRFNRPSFPVFLHRNNSGNTMKQARLYRRPGRTHPEYPPAPGPARRPAPFPGAAPTPKSCSPADRRKARKIPERCAQGFRRAVRYGACGEKEE